MATLRKNEAALSQKEWDAFIAAVNATHGMGIPAPRYRDFVQLHVRAMTTVVGMSWSVHSMPDMGMIGHNFLAWHRRFVLRLEQRLQQVDASVSIPYWDWIANPRIPPALDTPALLRNWGVTREWNPTFLPHAADIAAADARTDFAAFQRVLEQIHGGVHIAVGGTMAGASSPSDPLFFLHHANIDRLWSLWQKRPKSKKPANPNETLKPAPIIGVKVESVLSINTLGYRYG